MKNRISYKNEHWDLKLPVDWTNRIKGSDAWILTNMMPNSAEKITKKNKKWWTNSIGPQPSTRNWELWWMISLLNQLSFVGSRSWRRGQANKDTFKGTFLCQFMSEKTERS